MSQFLNQLQPEILKLVQSIGRLADHLDMKIYLIGGAVRDLMLGSISDQSQIDLDFTVEGQALNLAKTFAKKVQGGLTTHQSFATATVKFQDQSFDFVTARKESYAAPGKFPSVEFSNLKEDIFRRDFTINALAISLSENSWGELVDECDGASDLNQGLIRVFHDESFKDDSTRILRAIRFEQRFDFNIEEKTLALLRQALQDRNHSYKDHVSQNRYRTEVEKMKRDHCWEKCQKRMKELDVHLLLED